MHNGALLGVQAEVIDVRREADGSVAAYSFAAVPSGSDVYVCVDWPHRFDLMQQHTGVHSAALLVCPANLSRPWRMLLRSASHSLAYAYES